MKLLKRHNYTGTVCKIVSDDNAEVLGIVGTFKDLMELGVVKQVTNYSCDTWYCIPCPGRIETWDGIGATREEAIKNAVFGKKL